MFTGIIQTQAKVIAITQNSKESRFTFAPFKMFSELQIGESIAVNGACLTVEAFDSHSFSAYASAKTLEHTNLGRLQNSSIVNLERALALGDRLGGHIVSGHVDCTIHVLDIKEQLSSKIVTFELPQQMQGLVIAQGSVCVDGISLTVTNIDERSFSVNIIPETWKQTTVASWQASSVINFESDIIGKYIHSKMFNYIKPNKEQNSSKITEEYLREMGF